MLKTKFHPQKKSQPTKENQKGKEKAIAPETFRDFIKRVDPKYRFYRHCDLLIDRLQDVADGKIKRLMIFMPPRHGKLLADDTPVPTVDGMKRHGDLVVGDYVFAPDGSPVKVVGISPKAPANVRVELTNGEVFYCHENHEWAIHDRKNKRDSVVETNFFLKKALSITCKKTGKTRYRYQLPTARPLAYPEGKLPTPPCPLGAIAVKSVTLDPQGKIGHCIQVENEDGLYVIGNKLTVTHNSRTATQLFPAYFLHRYPHWWTSISSYAADLAYTHSRLARDVFKEGGGVCRDDTDAVKQWATNEGGGLFASGVGGPLTGKGFMLGIIDDPLKNAEQAASDTIRDKQKEWYESTFYTREEPWSETDPNGAIVVILTRWHSDDLAGWLLKQEEDEDADSHERWHIVAMEAIKTEAPYRVPSTCTLEPDWRQTGEALCPERRPLEKLKRISKKIGSYFFDALFQQSPRPQSGNIIQEEWFKPFRVAPKPDRIIISADTANKVSDLAAYTVFTVWFVTSSGYYLMEVVRERINAPQRRHRAINLHAKWKSTAFLIEDKASGIDLIQYLKETTIPVIAIEPPPVDKVIRLSNESPAIEAGKVFIPLEGKYNLDGQDVSCPWVHDYIQEMTSIPFSSYFDQGDSTSQFLAYVREHGGRTAADLL